MTLHERGHVWEMPLRGEWVWQVFCETRIVGPSSGYAETEEAAWAALSAALEPRPTLLRAVGAWLLPLADRWRTDGVPHDVALQAIRAAWRSGYLAAIHDAEELVRGRGQPTTAAYVQHLYRRADGCDEPEDYLREAMP